MYSIFFSKINKSFYLVEKQLKKMIHEDDKVVIIPWSFAVETDAKGVDKFYLESKKEKYINPLLKLGIKENNISVLNCYRDKSKDMINLINKSDIIILPGGNPEMFYNKIIECNVYDVIKSYNKIIIGESAGAELQLTNYFITAKNNYYKKFDWYKGFAILNDPFFLDVHSSNNYKYLKKLQDVANQTKKDVYAIFDNGVLIYDRKNKKIESYGDVKKFISENN